MKLDETGNLMISEGHFASETIRVSKSSAWYGWPSSVWLVEECGLMLTCKFGFLKR